MHKGRLGLTYKLVVPKNFSKPIDPTLITSESLSRMPETSIGYVARKPKVRRVLFNHLVWKSCRWQSVHDPTKKHGQSIKHKQICTRRVCVHHYY